MRIKLIILLIFTTINTYADEMYITQGRATTDVENLYECDSRYRKSGIGHFIDQNKKRWIVPAPVAFSKARKATVFSNDTIGVNNKPAYMNFSELFFGQKAKFIWSSNVVLDNHVIVRKTVE